MRRKRLEKIATKEEISQMSVFNETITGNLSNLIITQIEPFQIGQTNEEISR